MTQTKTQMKNQINSDTVLQEYKNNVIKNHVQTINADMKKNKVLQEYKNSTINLVQVFIKKYFDTDCTKENVEDSFVGMDWSGDVFEFNDYYFNVSDVYYCIQNDVDRCTLFDWYEYNLQWSQYNHHINLRAWVHGCPRRSEDELNNVIVAEKRKIQAEQDLKNIIDELNNKYV